MIRISFHFTEYAISESGYDGDDEASSSDDGNQGNVRSVVSVKSVALLLNANHLK